jgi:hypothetical protein
MLCLVQVAAGEWNVMELLGDERYRFEPISLPNSYNCCVFLFDIGCVHHL